LPSRTRIWRWPEGPGRPTQLANKYTFLIEYIAPWALAFKRSGDPNMGNYGDVIILRTFGEMPENLDEL
jgi:hypothetical protein